MRTAHLMSLALVALLCLVGCGGSSGGDSSTPAGTTTATTQTTTAALATTQAASTNDVTNVTTDVALAAVSPTDTNTIINGSIRMAGVRSAVTLPTLPAQPPTIPSGSPLVATTTTIGTAPDATTIDWYGYVSSTDVTTGWAEWKTTINKSNVPIFTSYWQMAAPVVKTDTAQTRGFVGSGWKSNACVIYTIGTGTYQTTGAMTASGTQVGVVLVKGVPTAMGYAFDLTKNADGSMSGTVSGASSTSTFSRTAPDTTAIGTTNTYYKSTGTTTVTQPATTMNFTNTILGNNTMTVAVAATAANATVNTTLTYTADGSGSGSATGSLVGIAIPTITLTWDLTGAATATYKILNQTFTKSTYVMPRPVDVVPPKS